MTSHDKDLQPAPGADSFVIRELGPDERICEPGFYRLPLDRHHNQPCEGVSVTSGVLRKMELATPADVWAFHALNPKRWPDQDRDALRLGRAMHAYVEGGPELLEEVVRVLPANKPRRPTQVQIERYEEGKGTAAGIESVEFWRDVEADPRDAISEADWKMIVTMGKVLAADPIASAALGGEPEVTMAVWDDETRLWLLSRPDNVAFSGVLSDYKKISTRGEPMGHHVVDRAITRGGAYMQMAFADECFERLTGFRADAVGLVYQCDTPPHHVVLRAIDDDTLQIGRWQNRRAMRRFRECLDSGVWPGPGDDVGAYRMPKYLYDRLTEEMSTEAAP